MCAGEKVSVGHIPRIRVAEFCFPRWLYLFFPEALFKRACGATSSSTLHITRLLNFVCQLSSVMYL